MKSVLTAAIVLSLAGPAWATSVQQGRSTNLFNAGAACLPALPRYDTDVRKRPLAVVNEGNVATFVTCNYTVDQEAYDPGGGVEWFDITARNQSQSARTVTCTAVIGVDDGQARYIVKSVNLQPGQRMEMAWRAADHGLPGGWEGPVNLSCLLPMLTGLNEGHVSWKYRDR